MSPEAQRIAIAAVCGWKPRTLCVPYLDENGEESGTSVIEETMPDYLNDLNAMHEAELSMPDRMKCYLEASLENCLEKSGRPCNRFEVITATAAQRAEAFLRTLGKWVPGE